MPSGDVPPQSLSAGAAGIALLHIERAATGLDTWPTAHTWLAAATSGALTTGRQATLFLGAPAVAFAIGAASGPQRYTRALQALDDTVTAITRQRLQRAHTRIDRRQHPALDEFDLISGLTGLGAYLLRRHPHGSLVREVLAYLVRLTQPVNDLPGWWTYEAPSGHRDSGRPGGHANHGIAHGISGPLALLSLATRAHITVDGQSQAIHRICTWLDTWRQGHHAGPWWPETLTLDDLRRHRPAQSTPARPSWCYGTPGIARAQQLAGHASGDTARRSMAEHALAGCLADPHQVARLTDHSLCHGTAGVVQTAWRISADAATPELRPRVRAFADRLASAGPDDGAGFLRGSTGRALALLTAATDQPPASGWDTCLLLD
ncbi:lanthionine synthetase C family protein [Streptomonospora algeriensis]|uniref:Lanthionine synthetase C family protein n=1 Tax=Streptomonospora algeriensis TaxID=995084 RepID=A0ABW3B923_9ACTN